MKKITLLLLGCFVINTVCLGKDSNNGTDTVSEVVAGNTDFALSLYGKLAAESAGNVFFSPYSISTALALVYVGARGQTQTQIAETLHFTVPGEKLFPAFGTLQKQLIQKDKSPGWQVLTANAIWLQEGMPFLKEFLDSTAPFDAGRYQLDFVNQTEKSRQKINGWVEEQTKDKVKNLLPPNGIDSETALVITNAVYFKGQWKTKFSKWKTRNSDFFVSADRTVKVPLMHLKEKLKYYNDEKMQALELPYKGDQMSMLVFLPKDINGLKEVENTLTTELLDIIVQKMIAIKVDVYLPRFKITWGTVSLKNTLIALGMPDSFDPPQADFSGITGQDGLYVSDIFHKAFVEVNEEGTEAAGATSTVIAHAMLLESVFCADHPFLFMIRDNYSDSILFIGRLTNPTAEE
jgi:serpin B